jgi:hypothetical protein
VAGEFPEYMTTEQAENYSGLKGLASRRVKGTSPPYIKVGGKNSKVLYSRRAIDEWLAARTRKSTSEDTVIAQKAGA